MIAQVCLVQTATAQAPPPTCGLDDATSSVPVDPLFASMPISNAVINVPVFVHVVTASDGTGSVSEAQIDVLNGVDFFDQHGNGFTFYLVGVSRTANDAWFTGFSAGIDPSVAVTEPEALAALAQDPAHMLNLSRGANGAATVSLARLTVTR